MWVQFGVYSLTQKFKNKIEPIYTKQIVYSEELGRTEQDFQPLIKSELPIRAKFIVFRERDSHKKMERLWFKDYGSVVETTFCMALTGGSHWLFDFNNPVAIRSMHFHGYEHHSGRHIDINRIQNRLENKLRDYCKFNQNLIFDDRTGDHRKSNCQSYEDCQLLQLTDLLIGCFRTVLTGTGNSLQKGVVYPVQQLVQRWDKGLRRLKNSIWYKGFWISEGYLENGEWHFEDFRSNSANNKSQLKFYPLLP